MTRNKTATEQYADLDKLLDFAYSSASRRAAERARNKAVSELFSQPKPKTTDVAENDKKAA